jgi:hypothetical protein
MRREQILRHIARGIAEEDLFFGKAHRAGPLLRGLFLEPTQAVIEPLILRDHCPHLLKHIDRRVLVTQHDRRQDTDVIVHRVLPTEHPLHLSAQEFEGDVLGHIGKLVLLALRVNHHALSLYSSRPISMRRISEVPAPIS